MHSSSPCELRLAAQPPASCVPLVDFGDGFGREVDFMEQNVLLANFSTILCLLAK